MNDDAEYRPGLELADAMWWACIITPIVWWILDHSGL